MSLGWVPICQDCWQYENPGEYCPELTRWDGCSRCGYHVMVLYIRSSAPIDDVNEGDSE